MSEPLILVLKTDPNRHVAYACPDCHNVIQAANDNPDIDAVARKHAAEHCIKPCEKCGVVLVKHPGQNYPGWGTLCSACDKQRDLDRYQQRFDAAEKLTEQQYNERSDIDSVVYLEGEDKYFPDGIDELREWWCDSHYDPQHPDGIKQELPDFPEYVFTCTSITGVRLDADSILESALDEHHEDAVESVNVEALQKHLDEWSADPANQVTSWESNHKLLVLLSDAENAKFLEKRRGET